MSKLLRGITALWLCGMMLIGVSMIAGAWATQPLLLRYTVPQHNTDDMTVVTLDARTHIQTVDYAYADSGTLSPDARWLARLGGRSSNELQWMRVGDAAWQEVTQVEALAGTLLWMRDSRSVLIYGRVQTGNGNEVVTRIYEIALPSGSVTERHDIAQFFRGHRLSPDRAQVILLPRETEEGDGGDAYLLDLQDGALRRVDDMIIDIRRVSSMSIYERVPPVWSADGRYLFYLTRENKDDRLNDFLDEYELRRYDTQTHAHEVISRQMAMPLQLQSYDTDVIYKAQLNLYRAPRAGSDGQRDLLVQDVLSLGAWSPDGQYVHYRIDDPHTDSPCVFVLNVQTRREHCAYNGELGTWLPDSQHILYRIQQRADDTARLYLVRVGDERQPPQHLADIPRTASAVTWHTDEGD